LVLSWSGFRHTDRFRGNGHKQRIFCFRKPVNSKLAWPYNKLLTNRASSSRTGEYWPSVVFVRTSLRSVRTATTSGQYSAVRPSRSVSKRLLLTQSINQIISLYSTQTQHHSFFRNFPRLFFCHVYPLPYFILEGGTPR